MHVIVVIDYDEGQVLLTDPGMASAPVAVVWDEFLMAWAEFDETSVVIRPISQTG